MNNTTNKQSVSAMGICPETQRNVKEVKPRANEDRRITRSKRALRDAMISLMKERGFDNITVNDLCVKADLNRGTFYNHFRDKEDLLMTLEEEALHGFDGFQDEMKQLTLKTVSHCFIKREPLPPLVALFDYLREQGSFFCAVLGPGGDASFGPRLRDAVCLNLVRNLLHEQYKNSDDPLVKYYIAFFASAYLGVILHWFESGMKETSEEMALIAVRLLFMKPGESIKW